MLLFLHKSKRNFLYIQLHRCNVEGGLKPSPTVGAFVNAAINSNLQHLVRVGLFLLWLQEFGVAVSVLNAAGDAAEGGRGNVRLGDDLVVGVAFDQ